MLENKERNKKRIYIIIGIIFFIDMFIVARLPEHYHKNKVIFSMIFVCVTFSIIALIIAIVKEIRNKNK